MNKNKKRTASGLILAGTSLASIAGQAATNVNAEGSIFGSIKNFFVGNSSSKAQKDKAVKLKDKARSGDLSLVDYIKMSGFVLSSLVVPMTFAGVVVSNPVILSGVFVTLVLFAHINKIGDKKIRSDASKAAENIIYKLKHEKGIKEDMLNKQYTLKEFEDIVKDDEECSEFIRQLLVLERNPDEIDDEGYKLLDNGELEDAKEVLRKLFLEVNSADKIKDLKKLSSQDKEKLLKVVKPLSDWLRGAMPKLFGEGDYFNRQKDIEFRSKVFLLENAIDDYLIVYSNEIEANDFIDFICCNKDVKEKAYTKEYKKHSFIYITREFLEKSGVDVKLIDDDLLLDSAKILFGDLQVNTERLDEEENEDSKKPLLNSVIEKYYSKFKNCENPAEMSIAVLDAIETWIKETVIIDNVSLYNRNNQQESFQNRISAMRSQLKNVDQEKV